MPKPAPEKRGFRSQAWNHGHVRPDVDVSLPALGWGPRGYGRGDQPVAPTPLDGYLEGGLGVYRGDNGTGLAVELEPELQADLLGGIEPLQAVEQSLSSGADAFHRLLEAAVGLQ